MSISVGGLYLLPITGVGDVLPIVPATTDPTSVLAGLNMLNLADVNLGLLGSTLLGSAISTHGVALTLPMNVDLGGVLGTDTADVVQLAADTVLGSAVLGGGDDTLTGPATAIINGTIDGGDGNDTMILGIGNSTSRGGAGDDHITYVGGGNNTIDGGSGADTMAGGSGNDTYVVDNSGDQVVEYDGDGTDMVKASITYTLPDYVENLVLTGHAALNGTGNDDANSITGNDGTNVLNGGLGVDTMIGGAGDDTYFVDNVSDQVVEAAAAGTDTVVSAVNYTLTSNVENLTLAGSALRGAGNALDNLIQGNSGNNVLDGHAGADTMAGDAGNDIYNVDNIGDHVVEGANGGVDTVKSSITYTLPDEIERLILGGHADIDATGNAAGNTLYGNAGANILDGGAGADHMTAGGGNDTYIVDNVRDVVVEGAASGGLDTVQSSVDYTLTRNVENLVLTGSAVYGAGNMLGNLLRGNDAGDRLLGAAGNDTIVGGAGDDTITGGAGTDVMTGGAGRDSFIFKIGDLGGRTAGTADAITDFSHADGDRINLSALDADATKIGNQAFSFIGEAAFTGHAGQLAMQNIEGTAYLAADTNGDSHADFLIKFDDLHDHLVAADVIV